MNKRLRLTLLLTVVLGLALGGIYWLDRDQVGEQIATAPPFTDVQFEEIVGLHIDRELAEGGRERFSVARTEGGWSVTREGGAVEKAHAQAVAAWCEAFQATRHLRVLHAAPQASDLVGAGLGAGRQELVRVDLADGGTRRLAFGATDGAGGINARVDEDGPVLVLDAFVREELLPAYSKFEDRSLVPLRELDVTNLEIELLGAPHFAARREGTEWMIDHPAPTLGDRGRIEELRHALLGLAVLERRADDGSVEFGDPPLYRVALETARSDEPYVFEVGGLVDGRAAVRTPDREGLCLVDALLVQALERPVLQYRDRRLVPMLPERIRRLTLVQGGSEVRYERLGGTLSMTPNIEGARARSLDPVMAIDLLDRLVRVEVERHVADLPEFAPRLKVEAVWSPLGEPVPVTRTFLLGAVDAEGLRPVRIEGEAEGGLVRADQVAFLEEPWWSRLGGQLQHITDAYFRIGVLRLTDHEGKVLTMEGYLPQPGADIALRKPTPEGPREVPPEVLNPARRALIEGLAVDSWVGEGGAISDEDLHLEIALREVQKADGQAMHPADSDPWRVIRFARRGADGLCRGHFAGDVNLSFYVRSDVLLPFTSMLEWDAR